MLWFSFSFPEGISEIPFTAMASRVISYSFLPSENKGKVCVLGTGSLSAGLVMLSRLIVVCARSFEGSSSGYLKTVSLISMSLIMSLSFLMGISMCTGLLAREAILIPRRYLAPWYSATIINEVFWPVFPPNESCRDDVIWGSRNTLVIFNRKTCPVIYESHGAT